GMRLLSKMSGTLFGRTISQKTGHCSSVQAGPFDSRYLGKAKVIVIGGSMRLRSRTNGITPDKSVVESMGRYLGSRTNVNRPVGRVENVLAGVPRSKVTSELPDPH